MSKGLAALKDIKRTYYDFFTRYDKEQFDTIEEELKESEKNKQILDTLKEALQIDETDFFHDVLTDKYYFIGAEITKEKYDLLKEALS